MESRIRVTDRALEAVRADGVDPSRSVLVIRHMDHYSNARLESAAIDYDPEKETEGFWLDHEDAASAAFC
jgi:hypothetical protein